MSYYLWFARAKPTKVNLMFQESCQDFDISEGSRFFICNFWFWQSITSRTQHH